MNNHIIKTLQILLRKCRTLKSEEIIFTSVMLICSVILHKLGEINNANNFNVSEVTKAKRKRK